MGFEEFKEKIVERLQEIYGDEAVIDTGVAIRNNGSRYNGINIFLKDSGHRTAPIVELDSVYAAYESGRKSMGECVWEVYHKSEESICSEELERFAEGVVEWEMVKNSIYPILLSTEENQEMLKDLISTPMLDLSVVYAIRGELSQNCSASIKINKGLLKYYGISIAQLHEQAMGNMKKDGYEFQDLESLIMSTLHMEVEEEQDGEHHSPKIYILTNKDKLYGAAGILNRKLLKEFAGDRDFIILPSSIHETLFVPVTDETDQDFFDAMVMEVNRTQVRANERLADHSYFYDAEIGEIRMFV